MSVVKIKETFKNYENFDSSRAGTTDINKIIKFLNSNKETGPDKIPVKLVKIYAKITDFHMWVILNQTILSSKFPEQAKNAVRLEYKNCKSKGIKNYRIVSIFLHENFIHNYMAQITFC